MEPQQPGHDPTGNQSSAFQPAEPPRPVAPTNAGPLPQAAQVQQPLQAAVDPRLASQSGTTSQSEPLSASQPPNSPHYQPIVPQGWPTSEQSYSLPMPSEATGVTAASATSPVTTIAPSPRRSVRSRLLALGGLLVALIVVGGLVYLVLTQFGGHRSGNSNHIVNYHDWARSTASVKSTGQYTPGYSWQYPAAFTASQKTDYTARYISLDAQHRSQSELSMTATYVGSDKMPAFKKELTAELQAQRGSKYDAVRSSGLLAESQAKVFTVLTVKKYTSDTVKDGVLVDATYQQKQGDRYVAAHTQTLFAFGKSFVYTASAQALQPVWQTNQSVFADTLHSLKVS